MESPSDRLMIDGHLPLCVHPFDQPVRRAHLCKGVVTSGERQRAFVPSDHWGGVTGEKERGERGGGRKTGGMSFSIGSSEIAGTSVASLVPLRLSLSRTWEELTLSIS